MTDLTISAVPPRVQYTGDGVQAVFAVPFPVTDPADIRVWQGDGDAPGAFTIGVDGAVTFAVPPGDGVRITILRAMPAVRGTSFQEGGEFRATAINDELDRLSMLVQQMEEAASRAVRLPPHAAAAATELPPAASGYLRWNDEGSALVYDPLPQTMAVETAAQAALAADHAAVAAAARDSADESAATASGAANAAAASAEAAAASASGAAASASAAATGAASATAAANAAGTAALQAASSASTVNMPTERRRRDLAHMRERVRPLVDPVSAPQPCLGIDFVQGTGADFMTFSRASTGTYFDSAGILRSATIDSPRYDHDPASGAPRGLLLETQRSNLLLRAAEFDNAVWTATGATITANAATAPDGLVTAERIAETAATSLHGVAQPFSAAAAAYTVSVFARAQARKDLVIEVSRAGVGDATARFDLATGTISATSGLYLSMARIESIGGGWYRCSVTTLPLSVAAWQAVFRLWGGSDSYTGDTTKTLLLWGAQAEAGTHPSSYIPTGSTAATRASDIAQVSLTGLGASAGDWSAVLHGAAAVLAPPGTNFAMVSLNNGGAYTSAVLQAQNTGKPTLNVMDSTLVASLEAPVSYAPAAPWRAAFRCRTDDFALVVNGGAAVTDSAGTVPAVDRIMLGRQPNGQDLERGWLRSLLMFPRGLSNAALQALTA